MVSAPAHGSKIEIQYRICAPTGTTRENIKDNITGIKLTYWHEKDNKTKDVTAGEAGECTEVAA